MTAPQHTDAWLQERAGHATASRFSDALAKIKTGEAVSRKNYRMQLVTERLTGLATSGFQNAAMLRGIELEPEARMAYEGARGLIVEETGFVKHPSLAWCGCSSDGLIGEDGLVELKCPESTTHLTWLEANRLPPEHVPQVQGQLWVTGRQWSDFCSYDPRFPKGLQLFIVQAERDEAYIERLAAEVTVFLQEVEQLYDQLMEKTHGFPDPFSFLKTWKK